ncbi:MAG: hypothetical protein EXQ64_01310 [Ilumatobacteraceae bacterium]|nr:hypothetical protein [Ilumatobacteraceae bacterium]
MKPSKVSLTSRAIFGVLTLSLFVLTACGTVTQSKNVLTVNGTDYTVAQFERLSKELISTKQIESATGQISGADSKKILSALVRSILDNEFLKANSESITDLDRKSVTDTIAADDPYHSWSQELQRLSVDLSVANTAVARVKTPNAKKLEEMYSVSPGSVGALCIRHIVVATEKESRSILQQLNDGADFIALAKELSTEPTAKATGGALQVEASDCIPIINFPNSFDLDFIQAALATKAGIPSGPIKSSLGYHVIMNRPYSEIAEALSKSLATDSGPRLALGYILTSRVTVNPRFGTWNAALGKVE